MPLSAGTKLGRYEVRSQIGAGGMGEVYRARDPKINREVAIKVLPAEFSADAERLRRFEQEAQAAGSLNHPNILVIYDVETHDGAPYVVSELLQGETLREVLNGSPISQRKATSYALQIAHGLSAAHEKGIVHRDLKPENIFVTRDDKVKILDFGIAKLVEAANPAVAQTDIPTRRVHTDPGVVIGTAGYMSPEQVRSKAVDHRSDIFSLGAVLYEMLSGRRAFKGESVIETLNAILKEDPPELSSTNANISPALERIVWHCLEKSPEKRFQSACDLAFALEAISGSHTSSQTEAGMLDLPRREQTQWRTWLPWLVAALAVMLAIVAFALSYLRRAPSDTSITRFSVSLPEKTWFNLDVEQHDVSISPDGRRLAFIANTEGQRRLYIRSLDQLEAQALNGTEGAYSPFWSPDSRFVGFFAAGKLKKIDAAGGPVQTICDVPQEDVAASWGRDGTILFPYYQKDFRGLYRVSAAGGAPTPAFSADKVEPIWVWFLPDGQHFLFYADDKKSEPDGIYAGTLGSQEIKLLMKSSRTRIEYAQPGYMLYAREGALMAQAFDASSLQLSGEPFVVLEHMPYFDKTGWAEFSVSETGALVYINNPWTSRLAWFDRTGREMGQKGTPDLYQDTRLSPDGQKLAVAINDARTSSADVWIYDLARDTRTRFAFGPRDDATPVWSPDGRRIIYFSCCEEGKSSLRVKDSSDTAGSGESLLNEGFLIPMDWSADGRFLIYTVNVPSSPRDLWVLPLKGEQKPFPFAQTEFNEVGARFSPDGHFVAYVSDESGADEVYVKRFEGVGEKWRVSTAGGSSPRWRRDGRELFYLAADGKLMSVQTKVGDTFEASAPTPLFAVNVVGDYDVTGDGQRFIVGTSVVGVQSNPFIVFLNWNANLKR